MNSVLLVGNFLSSILSTRCVCEELAPRLAARGWSVFTASSKSRRLPRLIDMITRAWRERNRYSVAQVDVFSGLAFIWAEIVCWTLRRLHKPYVLTLRSGNLPEFAGRWPRRVSRLLGSATAVTVPSRYLFERMRHYRADLLVLPNPVNFGSYGFRLRDRVEPRLIWLRHFHSFYNPSLAPRVIALLERDFPDIHITLIGSDEGDGSRQAMQQVARDLGVSDRITLTGGVAKTEVPNWLDSGDVFLNTTNVDNTPVSVIEAMACGMCIVSTNVGGIPYLLRDEHDALLVPPDDPEAMASAVRRILSDPALAQRLSRNARKRAEEFDWSVILPQWESLLTSVANGRELCTSPS